MKTIVERSFFVSFSKRPTRFELLEKEYLLFLKTIVFIKTISDRFLYDFFKENYRF